MQEKKQQKGKVLMLRHGTRNHVVGATRVLRHDKSDGFGRPIALRPNSRCRNRQHGDSGRSQRSAARKRGEHGHHNSKYVNGVVQPSALEMQPYA